MGRRKRTPEEKARDAAVRQQLLERVQVHEQRRENELAAREGRARRDIPVRMPSDAEVKRMLRERIAYYERRLRESPDA
jgi:hypothetical protein